MKTHVLTALAAACTWMCFTSCGKHWESVEKTFEANCWGLSDTLRLDFENSDTASVYQLAFPIRLNEDYAYHNIYLRATLKAPSGDQSVIPSEFVLASPTGEWLSTPSGDEIPFVLKVPDGMRFNQLGKYTISLYHFMRDPNLCGVEEAGIALDPMAEAG